MFIKSAAKPQYNPRHVSADHATELVKASTLRGAERSIVMHMARDIERTENRFWYSRPTLARVVGVNGSTIHRAMQRLIEKGVLALVDCYDFGRYLRIIYCLSIPALRELTGEIQAPKTPKCVGVRFAQNMAPQQERQNPYFIRQNAQNAHLYIGETVTLGPFGDGGDWERDFAP